LSSIQGLSNNYELMIQQLTASKSGSPSTSQAGTNTANSDPTDTVHLSLNKIRDVFQNARISYGEKDGKLTSDQAAQLQAQIATVKQTVSTDEQANGGPLTGDQKVAINQLQNQVSSQIYDMANNITAGSPDSITG
jgi:hypothetical protein